MEAINIERFIDIGVSILTSLIAALIFWYKFDFSKRKEKRRSISPIIEINFKAIYLNILFIFDEAMALTHLKKHPFQTEIISQQLTLNLLNAGLSNKSENNDYKCDKELIDFMVNIGPYLNQSVLDTERQIDRVLRYTEILTLHEIIILEELAQNLRKLPTSDKDSYHTNFIEIDNKNYGPATYNMDNYVTIFYELYEHFIKLQENLFETSDDREILIIKMRSLYARELYKESKKTALKLKRSNFENSSLAQEYAALSDYKRKGVTRDTKKKIITAIKLTNDKNDILGRRYFISQIMEEPIFKNEITKHYSEEGFKQVRDILKKEEDEKHKIQNLNHYLALKSTPRK